MRTQLDPDPGSGSLRAAPSPVPLSAPYNCPALVDLGSQAPIFPLSASLDYGAMEVILTTLSIVTARISSSSVRRTQEARGLGVLESVVLSTC
jgi:hypothetical protein